MWKKDFICLCILFFLPIAQAADNFDRSESSSPSPRFNLNLKSYKTASRHILTPRKKGKLPSPTSKEIIEFPVFPCSVIRSFPILVKWLGMTEDEKGQWSLEKLDLTHFGQFSFLKHEYIHQALEIVQQSTKADSNDYLIQIAERYVGDHEKVIPLWRVIEVFQGPKPLKEALAIYMVHKRLHDNDEIEIAIRANILIAYNANFLDNWIQKNEELYKRLYSSGH